MSESEFEENTVRTLDGSVYRFTDIDSVIPQTDGTIMLLPLSGGKVFTLDQSVVKRYTRYVEERSRSRGHDE